MHFRKKGKRERERCTVDLLVVMLIILHIFVDYKMHMFAVVMWICWFFLKSVDPLKVPKYTRLLQ